MLFSLAAMWGSSFLFMRVGAPALGPVVLIELRVLLAGITLLGFAAVLKHKIRILHLWKKYLLLGTLNAALPFCFIATAELHLSASLAAILNATTPLFTAVVAWGWLKEPFTFKKLLGIFFGIFGVVVLVGWDPQNSGESILWSVVCSLLAALLYAVAGVFSSRAFKGETSMDMAIGQQLAAALVLLPVSLFVLPSEFPSMDVVWSVLVLAVFCTAIGYLLYFGLMKSVGPVKALTVTFIVPVFGTIWGALFLAEAITGQVFVGMLLILMSVFLVSRK
ncbi:EamA family transporter [Tumebacillus sp. ITR2]|uniref:EamA family transporter n=2 Tax=Tumebacillus amylolyticus TaxID=2801339 RepID=A0ABS1J9J5_9BACL|nr:EamA family transporter [Tumebacillus amylolyticus]MBL0386719.1 EamA family transporter [Tumebacillus amylolyticus]